MKNNIEYNVGCRNLHRHELIYVLMPDIKELMLEFDRYSCTQKGFQ